VPDGFLKQGLIVVEERHLHRQNVYRELIFPEKIPV
jgi:hypothetical protein